MASGESSQIAFKLNNGDYIPAIGFGTWRSKPDDAYESVKTALQSGYRHIDTAFVSFLGWHTVDSSGQGGTLLTPPLCPPGQFLELWQRR